MAYQVVLADAAKAEASQIYDWVVARAPIRGPEWFEDLIDSLYSPERELPFRCPFARAAETVRRQIRCLVFGKRKHGCRSLFEVDEERRAVWILHFAMERYKLSRA